MPSVLFIPSGKRIAVEAGTLLSDACRTAAFPLPMPCGGKGTCGKCRVQILQGDVPVTQAQMTAVNASLLVSGWRAACATKVGGDLVVAEPSAHPVDTITLTTFQGRQPGRGSGFWHSDVALEPPRPRDAQDDAERLLAALKANGATDGRRAIDVTGIRLPLLAELPRLLREKQFRCRVTGMGGHILGVRGEASPPLGLAVDLGTTTIAAAVCDLETGKVLGVSGAANPQSAWGDDVVSRIEYAGRSRAHRDELRLGVVEKIASLADEAKRRARLDGDILVAAVAGNTVMTHLLLGVDPAALAVSPFAPAFTAPVAVWGAELGWPAEGSAVDPLVLVMPAIGSYVGGDVTAGLLAHDILEAEEKSAEKPEERSGTNPAVLYLDVGTNGEIVLTANGKACACATAAGPAFEGARISRGMRAAPGAISRVDWTEEGFQCEVIGGGVPRGLCGTGLLDAVAALLESGILDAGGKMATPEEAGTLGLPAAAAAAIHMTGNAPAVWLVAPKGRGRGTGNGRGQPDGVEITQRDVRETQLAKGAIAAGARVLLQKAGLRPESVEHVLLAGGFGSFLRPKSALAVGLLPGGIRREAIRTVGNAALAGARLYLHSRDERALADAIRKKVEYIELSGRPAFESFFAEEMLFPRARKEEE